MHPIPRFIMHYKKQPTHSHCIKVEGSNKSLTDLLKECEGKKGLLFSEYGVKIDLPCGKRGEKSGMLELSDATDALVSAAEHERALKRPRGAADESVSESEEHGSSDDYDRVSLEGSPALRMRPTVPDTARAVAVSAAATAPTTTAATSTATSVTTSATSTSAPTSAGTSTSTSARSAAIMPRPPSQSTSASQARPRKQDPAHSK